MPKPPVGRQFKKGVSGNPSGRAKDPTKELAREFCPEAIQRLVAWMRSKDARASVSACTILLDRAYGKPAQAVEHSGAIGLTHEQALAVLDQTDDEPDGDSASA